MTFENSKFKASKEGKFFRIQAKKNFNDVKIGDLGGFIEKEENLSIDDDAWIYDEAKVYENARLSENSVVKDEAQVYGEAQVKNSTICNQAQVYGKAEVNYSLVANEAQVFEEAYLEQAQIFNQAKIYGKAKILSYATIGDEVEVCGNVIINQSKKRYGKQKIALQKDVKINFKIRRKLSEKN